LVILRSRSEFQVFNRFRAFIVVLRVSCAIRSIEGSSGMLWRYPISISRASCVKYRLNKMSAVR
jgi:hypothetical protein